MGEKQALRPESDQYWKQYDRFIEQLRVELQQLYWLYSFFFAIDSGLLFFYVKEEAPGFLVLLGLLASAMWWLVFDGQRRVRNQWIEKVNLLDAHLDDRYRMWGEGNRKHIALVMSLLPPSFLVVWILILVITIYDVAVSPW